MASLLPGPTPDAATRPCPACPWLVANRGRRHPDGWYRKANLRRLWAGLRQGELMTCHPTDASNPLPPGARPVPAATEVRLCAGALALQERELELMGKALQAPGGSWAQYVEATTAPGLTKRGAARLVERALFRQLPAVDLDAPVAR